ncbi:hypothetical protein K466DRAFT_66926 [Polyporus arcularius HHB13444]|uniref:Uncharacterized protein n=1 Tax=Polyporus arcularius HHB13444 TaxID=1314778 RepID=A0A5C3PHP8_9APHY|nr:hypothetical protein K466DRAFT_66926 [Polyporus arcularius HHB13444]
MSAPNGSAPKVATPPGCAASGTVQPAETAGKITICGWSGVAGSATVSGGPGRPSRRMCLQVQHGSGGRIVAHAMRSFWARWSDILRVRCPTRTFAIGCQGAGRAMPRLRVAYRQATLQSAHIKGRTECADFALPSLLHPLQSTTPPTTTAAAPPASSFLSPTAHPHSLFRFRAYFRSHVRPLSRRSFRRCPLRR